MDDDQNGELIAARLQIAQLEIALDHRSVISAAVGIVMERKKISYDAAFAVLQRVSNETNVKIFDLAADLVTSGSAQGL